MKRILLIVVVFLLAQTVVRAISDEASYKQTLGAIRNSYTSMFPFYRKLYDCTEYSATLQDIKYEILGRENQKCHVKMGSDNCYFPMDIAKQYSTISEKSARQKINQIDSQKSFYFSTDEPASQIINNFHNQYCKIEW